MEPREEPDGMPGGPVDFKTARGAPLILVYICDEDFKFLTCLCDIWYPLTPYKALKGPYLESFLEWCYVHFPGIFLDWFWIRRFAPCTLPTSVLGRCLDDLLILQLDHIAAAFFGRPRGPGHVLVAGCRNLFCMGRDMLFWSSWHSFQLLPGLR